MGVGHGGTVWITQLQASLDGFACLMCGLVHLQLDVKVGFDIFGHPKCGGIIVITMAESKLVATSHGLLRQGKLELGAIAGLPLCVLFKQGEASRIEHLDLQCTICHGRGVACVLEFPTVKFDPYPIS